MASVQKRGYNRDTKKYKYTVIISCGFNPVTGKRIRKCLGTIEAKNKNDAKKKANTLESQYNQGLAIDKNEITLAQYLKEYLTLIQVKLQIQLSTTIKYMQMHISFPSLDPIKCNS